MGAVLLVCTLAISFALDCVVDLPFLVLGLSNRFSTLFTAGARGIAFGWSEEAAGCPVSLCTDPQVLLWYLSLSVCNLGA